MTTTAGDIAVTGLSGITGNTVLLDAAGAITDGNGFITNIVAVNLNASAATGIDLDTEVASITAAVSGTGAIDIDELNNVTLTSITTNNGSITIGAGGTTTIDNGGAGNAVTAAASGTISITANGAASDLVVNNGVQSAAGTITLTADDDLRISADVMTTAGNGAIDLNAGTDLDIDNDAMVSTVGNGAITGDAVRAIELESNVGTTTLLTEDGNITLNANQGLVQQTGIFDGILLTNSAIETDGGAISLTGRGGTGATGNSDGVFVDSSTIRSTGAGTIELTGTATDGSTSDGIDVDADAVPGTPSLITSVTGAITLTGTSAVDSGVEIQDGSVVSSTGTGAAAATITITGNAEEYAVYIGRSSGASGTTSVTSVNGAISITGIAQNESDSTGVWIEKAAQITSTGVGIDAATITINGSSGQFGTYVDQGTQISSVAGDISITGNGGAENGVELLGGAHISGDSGDILIVGTTTGDNGVEVNTGADVTSTGTATITINGTVNNAAGEDGVFLDDTGTLITSMTGNISITGSTMGNEASDQGVRIQEGAVVTSTGSATITIDGTSSDVAGGDGVSIATAGTQVASLNGDIAIDGTSANQTGISLTNTASIDATGTANITLQGTGGGAESGVQVDSSISSATGAVTIRSEDGSSSTDDITFGAAGAITSASGTVTIDADTTGTTADVFMANGALINAGSGLIDVDADVDVTLGGLVTTTEVRINAIAGAIIDGGNTNSDITAGTAALRAATGVGDGAALDTTLSNLAFSNTTSGNVQIDNTGGLTVTTVDSVATSSNVGAGTTTLTATSPVTFAVNTSSGGDLTATATESAAATDDITVNASVTVQSTAGDVIFNAGDDIILTDNTSIVSAIGANGDVTLNSGVADTDNVGTQSLDGQVNANTTNGVVTLNLNADGSATQGATGQITGTNLRLLSIGTDGSFALATSVSNDVDTIAAATTGSINFRDDDGVTVGTVTTVGITTSDDAVTIESSNGAGGTITVSQAITTAGAGTGGSVELDGAVTVNATITAAGGTVTLNGSTAAASDLDINANITSDGAINWDAPRDILVGARIQTVAGTGSAITLTADSDVGGVGGVLIEGAGQVDSDDNATLRGSDGFNAAFTANAGVEIVSDGANVQVLADGNISIGEGANAPAGSVTIINGAVQAATAGGTITITAEDDLLFGANGDVTGVDGTVTVTADTTGGNGGQVQMDDGALIDAGSGLIDVDADGNVELGGLLTTGEVQVTSATGNINDGGNAHTDIAAGTAALRAATGVGDDGNSLETTIATVAAVTESGDINLSDTGGLIIGTVDSLSGATITDAGAPLDSAADNITIVSSSPLTVTQAVVNNDGGNITLTATNDGGEDDDLTISANVTATGGDGFIDLNAGRDLVINNDAVVSTVGTGAITGDAVRAIAISTTTAAVQSVAGDITLLANGTTGTVASFDGISVNDATISTTTGAISLTGTGGDTGDDNHGVSLTNTGTISSTGNDAADPDQVRVMGTAVFGANSDGVNVTNAASHTFISTVDAAVSIIGNSATDDGVLLLESHSTTTGLGGSITIMGTTTGTGGDADGVTAISSAMSTMGNMATISVTGVSTENDGVRLNNSDSTTTGLGGSITIMGTTTGTGGGADGVTTFNSAMSTMGDTATISVTGETAGDDGVELTADSDVTTAGASTATITIMGTTTGANGANSEGVLISSVGNDVTITSAAGAILITGEASGTSGDGVEIEASIGQAIDANGVATVTIIGTGDESGVQIDSPISSETGFVTIRSEDGESSTDDITFGAAGDITSTSGTVTIDAENAGNTADVFMADGAVIDAGSGQIDVDADQNVTLGSLVTTSVTGPSIEIDAIDGAVIDGGDMSLEIVLGSGGSVAIRAEDGIGSGNALETDINTSTLAAINTTTGSIAIDDTGANGGLLTIGTVDGTIGVVNQTPDGGTPATTGFINISNASPITVEDDITANGNITLTTGDTATVNFDNLVVNALDTQGTDDVDITSNNGSITLNVGDDATISGDLTASALNQIITINIDTLATDADIVTATGGGTLLITAATSVVTTNAGTFINGGSDNDTFDFPPQNTTSFTVNGNPPVFGDLGVPPGDTLDLDFANVVEPPTLTTGVPGAGIYSFTPTDGERFVDFQSIETVTIANNTVNYHLVIDPTLNGSYGNQTSDPNNTDDNIEVRLNGTADGEAFGTELIVERTAVADGDAGDFVGNIFRGTVADILSLTVQGTDDNETLTINETNGLPDFDNAGVFNAVSPVAIGGVANTLKEVYFDQAAGFDATAGDALLNLNADGGFLGTDRGTTSYLDTSLNFTAADINGRSGALTGTTDFGALWVGQIHVGPVGFGFPLEAGLATFGTNSNDGSTIWIDLDQDGTFETAGGSGNEQIVDNSGSHALTSVVGMATLAQGTYNIAIAFYGLQDGAESVAAAYGQGNLAFGALTTINPGAGGQAGLWSSEALDNVHLRNGVDNNDQAEFVFLGRGGTDEVIYTLGSGTLVNQTYAVGDGLGGGDNQAAGNSEGAILTTAGGDSQLFYFTGLEPITVNGDSTRGRFTLLGDNEANQIDITNAATGHTTFTTSSPVTTQNNGVGNYEIVDVAANAFANIDVFGMGGADSIDLIALDEAQNSAMIELNGDDTLDGDTSNDTIRVRSYPAGNMSSLFGGAGDDTFNIFDANTTVDDILGPMIINGETGTDTVIVNDSLSTTSASPGANGAGGENVTVNIAGGIPAIEGIFGQGSAVQSVMTDIRLLDPVVMTQGSIETLTVSTSADNDDINIDMMGDTTTDLTTITINGSAGSDLFNIQSNTPSDAVTSLNGNADADQFFFEPGSFVLTGSIDGGAGNDALDYSSYGSGRTIQLTAVGTTDGFMGNDATAAGASITPVVNDSFDNIDILIGTTGFADTLIGAELRNHFDHGGDVAAFDDAHFDPTGGGRTDGGLALVNSLTDSGVLVADEADISLTGNAATIGRPTGANPITPSAGEQDLAFIGFQNYVGADTADDRFDLRDDAIVTGTINGRGGNDTIDYRDYTTTVVNVDLNVGSATNVFGGANNGLIAGTGGGNDDNSIENAFGGDAADMIDGDDDNNILGDGFGNDILHGDRAREGVDPTGIFSGNDTFRLEPRAGDNDIVFDINGSDTIDFSFSTNRVVYDADIVGSAVPAVPPVVQDVFNLGTNAIVDLRRHDTLVAGIIPQPATGNTPFENVIGSQLNDIIDIDPLSISGNFPTAIPVARFVSGNLPVPPLGALEPGDTLRFDGKGSVVQDTGLSITAQGVGTVAYRSIETLASFDDAARIIDNGDDFVTTVPNTTTPGNNSATWLDATGTGFDNDYLFSAGAGVLGGESPHTTTWTANGVGLGLYRVSITWPDVGVEQSLSSSVPVQVFDGNTLLATVSINQMAAPDDLTDDGAVWEDLGIFDFRTHTARIVLSNETIGNVVADAVRLEQISPGPELRVEVQDTGEYVADGVDIVAVTTVLEQQATRTFVVTNEGTTDLIIDDIELEQGGGDNWALSTPSGTAFTLAAGESSFITVTLLSTTANSQGDFPAELRIFSNDFDENVSQLLGQGVNPNPDGDLLNDVNPFTIQLNGVVSTVDIIDNGDVRFEEIGVFESSSPTPFPGAFGSSTLATVTDGDGDRALWTFSDLPDGRYRVSATWASDISRVLATAEYRVLDSTSILTTQQVDQSILPVGISDSGSTFQDLGGPFDITGGTIIVELRDTQLAGANNNSVVIADAIRIERLLDTFADATLFVGGTEVADDTGVVSFGTVLPGAQVQKTFTVRNDGALPLTVREPISLPDAYTLISFNGNPPTNATEVTLTNGQTVDFIVQLNAATVGEISGEMSFATGELAGGANADPDETPINITLTANVQSTLIVDNLDAAAFSTAGTGFQQFNGFQGYADTVLLAAGDSPGDTATWTFAVDTGSTYRIGATYTPFAVRATNAPYTVSGIMGGDQVIPINQQNTPDDRIANGSAFEDIGVFIAAGGTITVTLSAAGNGATIADAIRVEALFGPEIEVLDNTSGTNLQNATSTVDFGETPQNTALTRTFTITNDGQRALALGPVSLPGEFNLDTAPPLLIPAAVAGVPGSATFTVSLTAANAGTYGGVLSFATDDADEGPFSFNITGTVIGAGTVIDNVDGGPTYTSTGGFSIFSGAGRNGSFEASQAGNGTGTATWSFTGLAAGVYNVAATWTGFGNRASEATYVITDSTTGTTSVIIDQTANPDDFTATDGGLTSIWENLGGSFVVDGTGMLTVTLSDMATGYVDADAIRVERIGNQAEIILRDNASNSVADGSTIDFGNTTPGTPVVQNFTIQSVGDAALVLGALTLPTGFTTTYTPQTLVASTGILPITITYDGLVDATGTFSFFTNDDDETPFNIMLTGTAAPPSAIIDDNGDGAAAVDFAATAGFLSTTGQGFNNDVRFAAGSATETDTATWTFTVAAAGTYRVSSTWFPHTSRATDAPYTITGISGGPLTVDVNQQLTPGSFIESGTNWLDLETVHLAGAGTITVTLGNMADGAVIADAVRIEQMLIASPEIVVHDDDNQVIADGSTIDFGTVGQSGTLSKTFTVVNSGQLDLVVQAPALPPGFTSTFPLTTITPGMTADIVVNVTTTAEVALGGTLSLASNDADESPFNLNITATVEAPAATIIDNVTPDGGGFTSTGFTAFGGQGFMNDVHFTAGNSTSDTATWAFTGLADGQYQVSTTWTPHTNRATDAPYTINGGAAIDINQEAAPNDFQADGVAWEKLGVITVTGGTITVVLSDDADDFVIADAVRLDPVVGSEVTVLDGTTDISQGGTLDFGTIVQGTTAAGTITKTITVRNDGPDDLILQPISVPAGFMIPTNFTAGQMVASGATASFDITITTTAAGTLTDVLEFANNDADESPFNFTVTGVISSNSVQILDNGDVGYTAGDFVTFTGQGFGNDVDVDALPNTGGGTPATWTFNNLVSGGVYRVSTTWTQFSNRATDAPYTITGTTGDTTIDVNQEVAPDDFTDQGFVFEDLGIFTLTGTTLTVSLGDVADEAVIADAVRIEQITGPEITVFEGATEITDGTSAVDFGSTLVGGALSRVFTVNNVGATALQVEPITVPAGFMVVSDFTPAQMINPGASAMFEIGVITTGVNAPTGDLSFVTNDTDENPFNFNISATVATPAPVIIDDGDAAFTSTGGFVSFSNQGFQNDVTFAAGDSGGDTATWTFTGLQSGTYRVSATWTEHSTRATDAPYTINGGTAIDINQQLASSDVLSTPADTVILDAGSGVFFADLNLTFAHAGGDLTVVLSDTANQFVIADAIRVERTGPLQVVGGEARSDDADDQAADLTLDAATQIVTQAADILATTDLTDDQANALASVTVEVRDLADGYLGATSNDTIYLDINGAGYGWFVDSTPLFSEEFTLTDGTLTAIPDGPADGQVDLLTVVLHELGHVIGLDDLPSSADSNDLMSDSLAPGIRRLPTGSTSGTGTGTASNSNLPAASSSLNLTSSSSSRGTLESLLQTPLVGNRTPSELFADRQTDEQTTAGTQATLTPPSDEETNGIDTIFSIQTEDDTLDTDINFDEL